MNDTCPKCTNGIIRSLGRDNDEVIEDCPDCMKTDRTDIDPRIEDPMHLHAMLDAARAEIAQLREEKARLDWLLHNVSGREFRRLGIIYGDASQQRALIDYKRHALSCTDSRR
jgi:hypothetical protein